MMIDTKKCYQSIRRWNALIIWTVFWAVLCTALAITKSSTFQAVLVLVNIATCVFCVYQRQKMKRFIKEIEEYNEKESRSIS